MRFASSLWLVSVLVSAACRDREPAKPAAASAPAPVHLATNLDGGMPDAISIVTDEEGEQYVPAEFKKGADRWKDTGVYVDGKFVGNLAWAELPISLKPVWHQQKASARKRAGTSDTGWKWVKERRYRFTEYLRAIGVDLKRVKEVHVYGPKFTETIVADGKFLRGKHGGELMFRFGGLTSGKALPVVPDELAARSPDKISSVMVYLDKKPPTLERNVGLVLDGVVQEGVPYFGTPLRGGVRVYFDDRLVAYIKRQDLPVQTADKDAAGDPYWKLLDYLATLNVPVAKVAEAYVVREQKWQEKFTREELAPMTFQATAQAKGHIELGTDRVKAQALILRSKPLAAAEIPAPAPDEI
jgi:hypothetical protein